MLKLMQKKEIRFLFVGVLNTIFGYSVYALLCYMGFALFISVTISTILGTFHSFLWNKFYTFESKEKSITEILRFITVYFMAYLINLGVILYFSHYHNVDKYLLGIVGIFVSTIVSYVGHNNFSFKKLENRKL